MSKHPCRRAPFAQALAILIVCAWPISAQATLIVNPPRPITHKVDVQLIQTLLTDGSQSATVFGSATERASIEAGIDMIWAQAGIDINFLPSITTYANTFAYQGIMPPDQERPIDDLSMIASNARIAGKTNPDSRVINMFFVEISPGFKLLSPNYVAGVGYIGSNGIAAFIGSSKLSTQSGHDVIAGVIAHEIGHNLGLDHTTSKIANLMSPGGTSDQISQQQINDVFQIGTFFLQEVAPLGDFTGDGIVNGADLNLWQGAFGINANGDADGDGDSDGVDFLAWQKYFSGSTGIVVTNQEVPEPTTIVMVFGIFGVLFSRRRLGRTSTD